MAVPAASETTVSTRWTPKNAVMPSFHDRSSRQMLRRNVGQMIHDQTPNATRNQATRRDTLTSSSIPDQPAATLIPGHDRSRVSRSQSGGAALGDRTLATYPRWVSFRVVALATLILASTVTAPAAATRTTPNASASTATTPAATASAPAGTPPTTAPYIVPPPAPKPTDPGNSPQAPDPHPPAGGHAPDGTAVGGAALVNRGLVLPPHAPKLPPHLTARAWMVADLDTGAVLAGRDPHGRYQPASIQKLLTAVTLLPLLPGGQQITVSKRAANTEGSHAGLVAGGRYTVDDLFRGLLLVSGNDTAEALADAAGGRAAAVARMNATARTLGAYDTFVETPSGLDGWRQLTSAYDMTLVLRAALAQPRFLGYDTVRRAFLPPQRRVGRLEMDNQNVDFLTRVPGALAAKTGFTDAAQHTFAGAIAHNGHRYGVVLMRAQRWPLDQWQQATALVNWATHLPAGTPPVGRLDRPAGPPSHSPAASPATVRRTPTHAAASRPEHSAWPLVPLVGGVALVAGAGGVGWRRTRRR
jgi:D-alanyl-D-alanine carboxypeptidase (penicillin-binding protein 5/6)